MSKKTREEKIIAELRRKLKSLKVPKEVKPVSLPTSSEKPIAKERTTGFARENLSYDYSLVAKDLRKTFFLTTLALSLEFVLYFILK